jgi:hypothetical protein
VISIAPLEAGQREAAAALFAAEYRALRDLAPELPARLTGPAPTVERLGWMDGRALAAVEGGRLLGYIAWWLSDDFRRAGRRGAYVPEWGHGTVRERRVEVYRALYRAAAA